jgi:hypothetical protein
VQIESYKSLITDALDSPRALLAQASSL